MSESESDGLEVNTLEQASWRDTKRYREIWAQRNAEMAELLSSCVPEIQSLAVFGCGPYQSFEHSFKSLQPEARVTSFDLKAWNHDVIEFDLCRQPLKEAGLFDCIVLSGVLEFVDILSIFREFSSISKFILFSYTPLNPPRPRSALTRTMLASFEGGKENSIVGRLQGRIAAGWKNHFTIDKIVEEMAPFGYFASVRRSNSMASQVIFLARSWSA